MTLPRAGRARYLPAMMLLAPFLFLSRVAAAQPGGMQGMESESMGGMCPMMGMHGGWGIAGIVLGSALALAAISVLVALTVFLLRRSKTHELLTA